MTDTETILQSNNRLTEQGYWPAVALGHLKEGRFSRAVEICRERMSEEDEVLSGRLIYALALYRAGQVEPAIEQFYAVLAIEPDNLTALKYLGDLKFDEGDEIAAQASYHRILEIDPLCEGLKGDLKRSQSMKTRTIKLNRPAETETPPQKKMNVDIPFFTETIGDLYMKQGYPRLASEVFDTLLAGSENPRLMKKLDAAREKINEKEL
jgi:tetratricopeptide (TPR) repeat protein